jgi:hypothetical protein
MAIVNEILVGRYNRYVQKLFSMKGPAALNQVAGELQMSINFNAGAELRILEGWDLFSRSLNVLAGAATFSSMAFRNPAGSNVIAVLTGLTVSQNLADAGSMVLIGSRAATTDAVNVRVAQGMDTRGRAAPTCIVSENNGSVVAVNIGGTLTNMAAAVAGAGSYVNMLTAVGEIPILPGSGFQIGNGVVTQQVWFTVSWRERFLEESERT